MCLSKSNVSRGQERTILNYFFGLETHINIYDVECVWVYTKDDFKYTKIDFSGIDITGGDILEDKKELFLCTRNTY